MGCRGLCEKQPKRMQYIDGWKSCTQCGRFFKTKRLDCPCCNLKLKNKPKASKRKMVYYKKLEIKNAKKGNKMIIRGYFDE